MAARTAPTWHDAALRLAGRSTRRARLGVCLPRLAFGILAGALPAVVGVAFKIEVLMGNATLLVCAGALLGLLVAIRAAGQVAAVDAGDAAWALDRLARAQERGLTAATVDGPRGAEAQWSAPALVPVPTVKLLPPRGLALLVGAVLIAGVALVGARVGRAADPEAATSASRGGPDRVTGPGGVADGVESAAAAPGSLPDRAAEQALAERTAAQAVARALALSPEAPLDPAQVARQLADPKRRAAAEAAARGTSLERILGEGARGAESLAEALGQALAREAEAAQLRREAVVQRAHTPRISVPASRQGLVERYYELGGS